MTAPVVQPVGPHAPKIEMTMFRFTPIGNVRPIRAIAFGTSKAGPMPWNARATLSMMDPET
jgi:hypothetical protein